jgi:hypothetical protein
MASHPIASRFVVRSLLFAVRRSIAATQLTLIFRVR